MEVECRGVGDLADGKAASNSSYSGKHGEVLAMDGFVVADVGAGHVHEIVGVTGHQVATLHIGHPHDLGLELVEEVLGLRLE